MEWKKFKESDKRYPEELVEKSIKGFSNATDNLLEILIEPSSHLVGKNLGSFAFKVSLVSNTLKNYKFEIMKFGYDVELYPVKIHIEESLSEETTGKLPDFYDYIKIEEEERFEKFIVEIFETKRFNEIVSGLMKISKKYVEA